MKKNIVKGLFSFFLLLGVVFGFQVHASAASSHGFYLKAYVCDPSTYQDNYQACLDDYRAGSLSGSYELTNNSQITPESTILYIVNYRVGPSAVATGFSIDFAIDTDAWTIVEDSYGDALGMYDAEDNLPSRSASGARGSWDYTPSYTSPGYLTFTIRDKNSVVALTEDTELGYFFLTLNADAPVGDLGVNINPDESYTEISDASGTPLTPPDFDINSDLQGLTLEVTGGEAAPSKDASLKTLSVKNGSTVYPLNPGFVICGAEGSANYGSCVKDFTVVVPNQITTIDIDATANDPGAQTPTGIGTGKALTVGDNTFKVTSTAEFGNQLEYNITVKRLDNNADLSSLTVTGNGITGSLNGTTYTGTVPFGTESVTINAVLPENSTATIEGGYNPFVLTNYTLPADTTNTTGLNTKTVTVSPENCKAEYLGVTGNTCVKKEYTVEITRGKPSTNNHLTNLTVDGVQVSGFASNVYDYVYGPTRSGVTLKYGVMSNVNSVTIVATLEDEFAQFSASTITSTTGKVGTGTCTLQEGANTCSVTVKAQDPETPDQVYNIEIWKFAKDATLSSLTLTQYANGSAITGASLTPAFVPATQPTSTYKYIYDPEATSVEIHANVNDIITVEGANLVRASVSLTDGETTVQGNADGSISYTFVPTAEATGTQITITVTAENGDTIPYVIDIEKGKSSDVSLNSLTVTDQTVTKTTNTKYAVTVNPEIDSIDLQAVATSVWTKKMEITGAGLTITSTNDPKKELAATVSGLNFGTNTVTITVTAENGMNTEDYELVITRLPYAIAEITNLSATIDGVEKISFVPATDTYQITADYDETSVVIGYEANEDYNMTITGDGTHTLKTGVNNFDLVITSQAKDDRKVEKTYHIQVTRAKNSDTTIESITVRTSAGDLTATCDSTTKICTLPSAVTNAFVEASSTNVKVNFPAPILESDGPRATATVTTTAIETTEADGTTIINEVPISVTAAAGGSAVEYTLQIERTKSAVNTLTQFRVYVDGAATPRTCDFTTGSFACTINIPVTATSIRVEGVKNPKAKITYTDGTTTGDTYALGPSDSEKDITATVRPEIAWTAEPEDTTMDSVYTITINRDKSSNNDLSTILSNANSATLVEIPSFGKNTTLYTLRVPGTQSTIDIQAVAEDPKATVTVSGVGVTDTNSDQHIIELTKSLQYGTNNDTAHADNRITITVEAENKQTKTYTIDVIRKLNVDGTLDALRVDSATDNVTGFVSGSGSATFNLPDQLYTKTSLQLQAITKDSYASITGITINGTPVSYTQNSDVTVDIPLSTRVTINTIVVTVDAHDKNAAHRKTYTLKVVRAKNDNTNIDEIEITTAEGKKYAVCDPTTTLCTVKKAEGDTSTGTHVVVPNSYKIANAGNIKVTLPAVAADGDPAAKVEITETQILTDTIPNLVPIKVTAENGTIVTYHLQIERTLNNVNTMTKVNLYKNDSTTVTAFCNLGSTDTGCTITTAVDTTKFKLEGILADSEESSVDFTFGTAEAGNLVNGPTFTMEDAEQTKVITATVRAENGDVKLYTITVVRTKSTNSYLTSLQTNADQSDPDTLVEVETFSGTDKPVYTAPTYTLQIPSSQSTLKIHAEAFDSKSVVYIDGATPKNTTHQLTEEVTLNEPGEDTIITIKVDPEEPTEPERSYVLTVERESASNALLEMITINSQPINNFLDGTTFTPEVDSTNEYELKIQDYNVHTFTITATPKDTTYGKVKVNGKLITSGADGALVTSSETVNLQTKSYGDGWNIITVTGIAQDGAEQEYILKVQRKDSSSILLSTKEGTDAVAVMWDGVAHPATCTLNNYTCTITVPNKVTFVDDTNVVVQVEEGILSTDKTASVTMNKTELKTDLSKVPSNENTHTFTVHSADGTKEKEYTLKVTRTYSDDAKINGVTIYDADKNDVGIKTTFDEATKTYTVTVPESIEDFKVVVTRSEEHAIVVGAATSVDGAGGNVSFAAGSSTATIDVTSTPENRDTTKILQYKIVVQRQANTNISLKDLVVYGFDGINQVMYTLCAADDTTCNADTTKAYIKVDPTDSTKYVLTVPGITKSLHVFAVPAGNLATVTYTNLTTSVDEDNTDNDATTFDATYAVTSNSTKNIQMLVRSESSATQPYTLEVTVSPRTDHTLSSLTYYYNDDSTNPIELISASDPDQRTFDLTPTTPVANNISKITIAAVANDEDGNVVIGGDIGSKNIETITTKPDGNEYTITVQSEDGNSTEYVIRVKRAQSSDATLSILSIPDHTIALQEGVFAYDVTVDEDYDQLLQSDVNAVATAGNIATITKDADMDLVTTSVNDYNIKVEAEDGTTQTYILHITRSKSKNNNLKGLTLSGGATVSPTMDATGVLGVVTDFTINVPAGITSLDLTAIPEVDRSLITYVGADSITDGKATYTITEDQVIQVSVASEASQDQPTLLPKVYQFTIVYMASSEARLNEFYVSGSEFAFKEGTFNSGNPTVDFHIEEVPRAQEKFMVNAVPKDGNAMVHYYHDSMDAAHEITACRGNDSCEITLRNTIGTSTIYVQVYAQDGVAHKEYSITYTKVASKENHLSNIAASAGTFDIPFNEGTPNYKLSLPSETGSVELTFTAKDSASGISAKGSSDTGSLAVTVTLAEGASEVVTIDVTPQTGSKRTYTVTVTRANSAGNTDASLGGLSAKDQDGKDYVKGFAPGTTTYDLGEIPYGLKELTIDAQATDESSTLTYFVKGVQQSGNVVTLPNDMNGTITVIVQPTAGVAYVQNYVLTYHRKAPSNNAFLKSLTVLNHTITPAFSKTEFNYNGTVAESVEGVMVVAETEVTSSKIKINGNDYTSGAVQPVSGLQKGDNTVTVEVTAEDGTTQSTYKVTIKRESSNEQIASGNYGHLIEDGYIKTVSDNTTVLDMKNQLDNDNSKLEIWKADNSRKLADGELVGTGMYIKLIVNGAVHDTKRIVVRGDVNGDGLIDARDVSRVINEALAPTPVLTGPYALAADANKDGSIDARDVSRVINHALAGSGIDFR